MRASKLLAVLLGVGLAVSLPVPALAVGPQTDRLNVSYTNTSGVTSKTHIFAAGLDWTKTVGLMIYADGSAEYGLENPNDSYLLDADGSTGLVAVAKSRNMVLVTPKAPGAGCPDGDGVCWYADSSSGTRDGVSVPAYTKTQKTQWVADLISYVKSEYTITENRIVLGGYSSGAQLTTQQLGPKNAEALGVDLMVAISYGGAPKTGFGPNYSAAYKSATPVVWDVGTSDPSYQGPSGVQEGYDWYISNGFTTTELNTHSGTHSRSDFDVVMARETDQYIPASSAVSPPPANWQTTVTPTQTGAAFAIRIPTSFAGSTYVVLSSGNYLYTTLNGDRTLTFVSQACGTHLNYTVRTGSTTGTVKQSGSFDTLACARKADAMSGKHRR